MNILIKNADFSSVAVGRVDTLVELEKKCIITNAYFESSGDLAYIGNAYKMFAVDVSELNSKEIEVKGVLGSSKCLGVFYSGECPTSNITFNDNSDAVNLRYSLVKLSGLSYVDAAGTTTKTVTVPQGAKTLLVNCSSTDVESLYVKYSLV